MSSAANTKETPPEEEEEGDDIVIAGAKDAGSSERSLRDVKSMDTVGLDVLPGDKGEDGADGNGEASSQAEDDRSNPKSNLKKGVPPTPPSLKKKVSFAPLEIESDGRPSSRNKGSNTDEEEGNGDEFDDEIDRLLDQGNANGISRKTTTNTTKKARGGKKSSYSCRRCCSPYKIGNCTVLCPTLYYLTNERIGIVGPHWWGASCTLALLWGVSFHFLRRSARLALPSFVVTVVFTVCSTVALFFVACTNPGIVTTRSLQPPSTRSSSRNSSSSSRRRTRGSGAYSGISQTDDDDDDDDAAHIDFSDWRYCDLCSIYQPPDAAHCPECNVCVAGYDHHCPWMGTCIGKNNMRAFIVFNSSWFIYLVYAIAWLTFIGPTFHKLKGRDANTDGTEPETLNATHSGE